MPPIPEGYRRIERLSPFNALVGPLYERREGEAVSIGLLIEPKHSNSRGICHGGVLATLADLALGYAMLAKSGDRGGFVTAHLAFANCYLLVGDKPIVRASAIFARDGKRGG
jgi:acyl-coenzyme A thioesterase PaaI-like protein